MRTVRREQGVVVKSVEQGQRMPRSRVWQVVLLGLLMALPVLRARAAVPAMPGWQTVFSDDFDGAAGRRPDPARWKFDLGHNYPGGPAHWGTHEVQRYTDDPANVSLDGRGHLRITPLREPDGEWTSARIETWRDDFRPPEGGVLRMEARLRMPQVSGEAALGYWPAFWALGESFRRLGVWPQSGEFDIMENVNGLNLVWGTLHCGVIPDGPCDEPNGIGQHASCEGGSCQDGFHTYTFEWDRSVAPEALRWYLDGKLYGVITRDRLPPVTWQEITGQRGYFLLLDVAMGGDFAYAVSGGRDTPTSATEPGHPMVVDYVAVWTRAGSP
ncbi:glycoside hydrolase family 16 protein [Dyella lutea]|uniref:Glycoside hydrolase family 16 protein n=1 Tax=Dyella lutea TaxID=2950441 RepID=A0ABT1F854_9GAMM|nr:glycoside hydrolase family 16 protein [Dyella lutea]